MRILGSWIYSHAGDATHVQHYTFNARNRHHAYNLALWFGRQWCFGRTFDGVGNLAATDVRLVRKWELSSEDAAALVREKTQLDIFAGKSWWDPLGLRGWRFDDHCRLDLESLKDVAWYSLEHAYGSAFDIPMELRRLTSSRRSVRAGVFERLYGTIYHQGSIFPATIPSIGPLLDIIAAPVVDERERVAELFKDICESANQSDTRIQQKWEAIAQLSCSNTEDCNRQAKREVRERAEVRAEIAANIKKIQRTYNEAPGAVQAELEPVLHAVAS